MAPVEFSPEGSQAMNERGAQLSATLIRTTVGEAVRQALETLQAKYDAKLAEQAKRIAELERIERAAQVWCAWRLGQDGSRSLAAPAELALALAVGPTTESTEYLAARTGEEYENPPAGFHRYIGEISEDCRRCGKSPLGFRHVVWWGDGPKPDVGVRELAMLPPWSRLKLET